jgi:hypothetical protein
VYPQGFLELTKTVTGEGVGLPLASGGAWGDGPFLVIVDCRFPPDGGSLAGYPQAHELVPGETLTFGPLPVGSQCTITELIDAGATAPTFIVDGVPRPSTVPGSAQVTISDADITTVEIDPNGAELVNPFLVTQLRIIKTIEGEGAELATLDFEFRIDCVQLTRRFEPIFVTMDRPEESEVIVEGLPVGALCTVFEIDDGGADEEGVRLVGVVRTELVVPPAPPLTVDATNTFSAGQLVLGKVVEGPGAAAALDFEYQLLVECERPLNDGTFEPFLSETVTVGANAMTPVDALIPIGSRCWAEEVDTAGATSSSIDFDSPDNAAVITFEAPMITITATNVYDVGAMTINKVVTGDRAAAATQPFTFAINCTLGGTAQPAVTVTITPPNLSATIPGMSTGAECTVTETGIGGADAPAVVAPATVVIGAADQQPVSVTATNTFSSDPPPPPAPATGGLLPATGPSLVTAMAALAAALTVSGLILRRASRPLRPH